MPPPRRAGTCSGGWCFWRTASGRRKGAFPSRIVPSPPFLRLTTPPGSRGYRFDTPDGGFGLLTDSGVVTPEAEAVLSGVALAVLEANHDAEAVRSGPYPYFLKERILGPGGHLRNEDAAAFAVTLARAGAREIVLAHLSRENNTPAMALRAVEAALGAAGLSPRLSAAPRDCLSRAYVLEGGRVCSG